MAISRKPKNQNQPVAAVDVDALIAKGGSIAKPLESLPQEKATSAFTLRVPSEILVALDDHLKKSPYKVPRQQWILEAIMQRLEREALPYSSKDT